MTTLAEQLEQSGILVHTSKGVSMRPLLRENRDLIVVRKKGSERFCKYDVVLFQRQNGEYVLHRIRRVSPDSYWIVGDNCVSGELVRDDQILGVLVQIVREGKTIQVSDRKYLLFVHFWWAVYPIRVLYKIMRTKTAAVYKRIQRMSRLR